MNSVGMFIMYWIKHLDDLLMQSRIRSEKHFRNKDYRREIEEDILSLELIYSLQIAYESIIKVHWLFRVKAIKPDEELMLHVMRQIRAYTEAVEIMQYNILLKSLHYYTRDKNN